MWKDSVQRYGWVHDGGVCVCGRNCLLGLGISLSIVPKNLSEKYHIFSRPVILRYIYTMIFTM